MERSSKSTSNEYRVELRKLSDLYPDPEQPRKIFSQEAIDALAESIKAHGLIKNIEINAEGMIITGENRFRAAKIAGLKEIPCRIVELSPQEKAARQLAENIHHVPMNAMDIARAMQAYVDSGMSQREIAQMVGKHQGYVSRHLAYLSAPEKLQNSIASGELSKHAATFLERMFRLASDGKISQEVADSLEKKVKSMKGDDKYIRVMYRYVLAFPKKIDLIVSIPHKGTTLSGFNDLLSKKVGKLINAEIGDNLAFRRSFVNQISSAASLLRRVKPKTFDHQTQDQRDSMRKMLRKLHEETEKWIDGLSRK